MNWITSSTASKLFCRFGVSMYEIAPPGLNLWNSLSSFNLENASISSNTGTWYEFVTYPLSVIPLIVPNLSFKHFANLYVVDSIGEP